MQQLSDTQSNADWSMAAAPPDWSREMPAQAAHDLGNMLQVAISTLWVTRRQLNKDGNPQVAVVIDDVLDALDRAGSIARRIMTRTAPPRHLQPVAIASSIHSLSKLICHALGDGIILETCVAEDMPQVLCDPRRLDDALLNLATNARDAMPHGGKLVIEAYPCAKPGHGGQCIVIDVTDSGCGMPPDVAARAFKPFFTTKRPHKGTGLGLSSVRNFVERLGGSVEIQSAVAKGTRLRMHLPALRIA